MTVKTCAISGLITLMLAMIASGFAAFGARLGLAGDEQVFCIMWAIAFFGGAITLLFLAAEKEGLL